MYRLEKSHEQLVLKNYPDARLEIARKGMDFV